MIKKRKIKLKILLFAIIICTFGCVKPPVPADLPKIDNVTECCFILNEGIVGRDMASVTKVDLSANSSGNFGDSSGNSGNKYENYYFRNANPGLILGDNANDIMFFDSLVFVSVSGTGVIEVFRIKDGKSVGRIAFPAFIMPRKMALINDNLAFVTAYEEFSASEHYVYYFNPSDLVSSQTNLLTNKIKVGSHPEGICYDSLNNRIYVVNSGYGDLDSGNVTASTISIIDINSKTELKKVKTGANPNRIYSGNGRIYVICWGFPSDSSAIKGKLIEYEAISMKIVREVQTNIYDLCFNKGKDVLYFVNSTWNLSNIVGTIPGIYSIDLKNASSVPELLITNPNKRDIWTAIQMNFADNSIWVANSFNFNSDGEIIIYDGANIRAKFKVGNIPNNIKFTFN